LWLDNITREMLDTGLLKSYIGEYSVTGLTSHPTIFYDAVKNGATYDNAIAENLSEGKAPEDLIFDLAIEDFTRAAKMLRPIHKQTSGVDGWVSLDLSPLLAYDTAGTLAAAKTLYARMKRPNCLIKIPGTKEGLPAIEAAVFAGVPVNVTLLFSTEQYVAAAEAFGRGIERRVQAGLKPDVVSVASVFVSRWDEAVRSKVPFALRGQLGTAIAMRTYKAYRTLLNSPRWQRLYNSGGRPQRLVWAGTETKDPEASRIQYVRSLAAPFTINTMPEGTLKALASHSELQTILPPDGGDCEEVLARFAKAGIDTDTLGADIQNDAAASLTQSWKDLVAMIASKARTLRQVS
jgi:transaldolase